MREIQASGAEIHLPPILDGVERGETVVVTRHGRPIARSVPEAELRRAEASDGADGILAVRERTVGKVALNGLLSFIHEGHGY